METLYHSCTIFKSLGVIGNQEVSETYLRENSKTFLSINTFGNAYRTSDAMTRESSIEAEGFGYLGTYNIIERSKGIRQRECKEK